jgi:hypothetical protein
MASCRSALICPSAISANAIVRSWSSAWPVIGNPHIRAAILVARPEATVFEGGEREVNRL